MHVTRPQEQLHGKCQIQLEVRTQMVGQNTSSSHLSPWYHKFWVIGRLALNPRFLGIHSHPGGSISSPSLVVWGQDSEQTLQGERSCSCPQNALWQSTIVKWKELGSLGEENDQAQIGIQAPPISSWCGLFFCCSISEPPHVHTQHGENATPRVADSLCKLDKMSNCQMPDAVWITSMCYKVAVVIIKVKGNNIFSKMLSIWHHSDI